MPTPQLFRAKVDLTLEDGRVVQAQADNEWPPYALDRAVERAYGSYYDADDEADYTLTDPVKITAVVEGIEWYPPDSLGMHSAVGRVVLTTRTVPLRESSADPLS